MTPTDESLVASMARGDRRALGVLYERYSADVFRVSAALLRDQAGASDLVHDVFLEVWRRSAQYESSRGTVKSWIMIRARSRAFDRLRSAATKREVTLDDEGEGSVEQSVEGMNLPQALSAVSEEERAVLMLGYFEGLTCVEIGERLAIPVGTVKSRTRTAMQKLRAFFGEDKE
jgi:RNA polymerase sigma-70 factor (ECF subfamily)